MARVRNISISSKERVICLLLHSSLKERIFNTYDETSIGPVKNTCQKFTYSQYCRLAVSLLELFTNISEVPLIPKELLPFWKVRKLLLISREINFKSAILEDTDSGFYLIFRHRSNIAGWHIRPCWITQAPWYNFAYRSKHIKYCIRHNYVVVNTNDQRDSYHSDTNSCREHAHHNYIKLFENFYKLYSKLTSCTYTQIKHFIWGKLVVMSIAYMLQYRPAKSQLGWPWQQYELHPCTKSSIMKSASLDYRIRSLSWIPLYFTLIKLF